MGKKMGRVRTKTIKKAAYSLFENYEQFLSHDFDTNKRFIVEVSEIQTKSLRNKIAGFTTHLVKKHLQNNGPMRGVVDDIQEEENEKYKDISSFATETIVADDDTKEMLNCFARAEYRLLNIGEDDYVSLMDTNGNTKDDLALPKGMAELET